MTQLADRLSDLATDGVRAITFQDIGLAADLVRDQVREVAAGPLAPLLAEAVVRACDHADGEWNQAAAEFPAGFAQQSSVLALTSSLETLLSSAATTKALAKSLNGALLDGLTEQVVRGPLLAAARLEGAVRLAASDAVSPYRVWDLLEDLPADGPEDFLERLPRVLGVALDCWAQEETRVSTAVRALLQHLSVDEAADVDALFELGCDRLRTALSSTELAEVSRLVSEARAFFAAAVAAEEARDDAAAYLAVCDAILGFTAHDAAKVSAAADRVDKALERRQAWLHGTHQPVWLQPRRAAEIAWSQLLIQLRAAADLFAADVWMDSWQAIDAVLTAYRAARTIQPLGAREGSPGLVALVEPAVDDGFLRKEGFIRALKHAAEHPADCPRSGFDTAAATAILARLDARDSRSPARGDGDDSDHEDPEAEAAARDRVHRIAPTVVRQLHMKGALSLAANLSDDNLATVEGLAYDSDVARLQADDALINPLLDGILTRLSEHPDFRGTVRHTFSVLVTQTLLFLKSRADLTRTSLVGPGKREDPPFDYRRKPEKGHRAATEGDLQRDFHQWLQTGPLHNTVKVEPTDIGMGRADVMVQFGPLRYLTEMKQDSDDNSRAYIESKYLTQEAEYTNTNAPFGQLLVLDLTPKTTSGGTLRIDELAWLASHRPHGATTDRLVLAGIVTGNRLTPSAYSR
ncbi:hypothetical protein [Streptomyces sp. BI87]|uniref:hypothetical protein n=1 Tax=Streptomyces sp. BI87 TaxID=2987521 RepID=UPI002223E728|nr:hypothetical protein [Streptomyces sp. BI87]UYX96146.1 hypothetical protein OIM89_21585 [Streptomyces sp. BI87]